MDASIEQNLDTAHELLADAIKLLVNVEVRKQMVNAVPERKIITLGEAVERYSISRSTLRRYINTKRLKVKEIGGKRYVYIDDLENINVKV
jgi:predicted DNA-binding transcriptional regulator AlpA